MKNKLLIWTFIFVLLVSFMSVNAVDFATDLDPYAVIYYNFTLDGTKTVDLLGRSDMTNTDSPTQKTNGVNPPSVYYDGEGDEQGSYSTWYTAGFQTGTDPFSMCIFANWTDSGEETIIKYGTQVVGQAITLNTRVTGDLSWERWGGSNFIRSNIINDGNKHTVCVNLNSSVIEIIVDGVKNSTAISGISIVAGDFEIVGLKSYHVNFPEIEISEFVYYNKTLGIDEANSIHANWSAGKTMATWRAVSPNATAPVVRTITINSTTNLYYNADDLDFSCIIDDTDTADINYHFAIYKNSVLY